MTVAHDLMRLCPGVKYHLMPGKTERYYCVSVSTIMCLVVVIYDVVLLMISSTILFLTLRPIKVTADASLVFPLLVAETFAKDFHSELKQTNGTNP